MRQRLLLAGAALALSLLSFYKFPGQTFLQSDTQIYIPILEHAWDSSVLDRDLIATRPHVAFTIYDEIAIALRWLTGLGFEHVLQLQQIVFRALGVLGVYLIATSTRLPPPMALLPAAVYTLGATIVGPAVLTMEYEPVPRGFAVPLVLLAIGLCAHGRLLAGSAIAGLGLLYHPSTAYPFVIVFSLLALWRGAVRSLLPLYGSMALLAVLSRLRPVTDGQPLFARVDPALEKLQRMRASYSYVSVWIGNWWLHYLFLWFAGLGAVLRIRSNLNLESRFFLVGLPLVGIISVPMSYLLMEVTKWTIIPQVQPARALLYVTAFAAIGCAMAAMHAAVRKRWLECIPWLLVALAIPMETRVLNLLWPDLTRPATRTRLLVLAGMVLVAVSAAWIASHRPRLANAAWAAAIVFPFFAIPDVAKVRNYPPLHTDELVALSAWARSSTAKESVFLFPDADRDLAPGVFRARSLRAVYVDWKGGGQVNFMKRFANEWWTRWQAVMGPPYDQERLEQYREAGIQYIVLQPENRLADQQPVFENPRFVVYRVE